jgi:hypothetical protein
MDRGSGSPLSSTPRRSMASILITDSATTLRYVELPFSSLLSSFEWYNEY